MIAGQPQRLARGEKTRNWSGARTAKLTKTGTIIDQRACKGLNLVREVCERLSATSSAALEYDGWRSAAKAVER
jgi:hypothetical protein